MFNNSLFQSATKSINLPTILSSVSKGLNIIQRAMPIYEEAKPLISSAKKYITEFQSKNNGKKPSKEKVVQRTPSSNQPTFFQ